MTEKNNTLIASLVNEGASAVGSSAEEILLRLLYQLIIILIVTRLFVWISRSFLGQTAVAGEILAGLVLGPSIAGALFPELMESIFPKESSTIFIGISQIGLILLMFEIGLEFEFGEKLRKSRFAVAVISIAGVFLPFTVGFFSAEWIWNSMTVPRPDKNAFQLFFALALSITAIPILGRIFMELGLAHTRTAALIIGAAAIDDIVGWILLGAILTLFVSNYQFDQFMFNIFGIVIYIILIFLIVRPLLRRWLSSRLRKEKRLSHTVMACIIIVLFLSASVTSYLGIFALIGSFAIGVVLHENREFVIRWKESIGSLVHVFFLPIFFTYTGLRTDIGSLSGPDEWMMCLLVCLLAFVTKFGGTYIASRLLGENRRIAATIGISMNTRALMELIVLNIGYDLGILPPNIFTMLVIMAILSTFIATPLIRRLMRVQDIRN
ncbi:cation:proton antiporter [Xenorhabdus budapestensis]|uniref:Cation:proton antiporter n=1 Tax=Xenorhabdus budapestensis TaxID=290110 RepID=A0A2D0J149_XENBU|nr:cation:proton antiporter [Xenorhabdus budapestensis]PHM27989.1 putative potassium antiporter [Xenorhabdus budapestensis]QTL38535.1 cation:proton antiporter [Xenorhabdus budapestensis]